MSWDDKEGRSGKADKRDSSDKTANALHAELVINEFSLRVTMRGAAGATLISGDLQAAINMLAPGAVMLGLGATLDSQTFALRMARDRALLITALPLAEAAIEHHGWQSEGFATSAVDDAWTFFDVSGSRAATAISEGCAADLESGSPSAAVLFATHTCLLVRQADGFLLAVESSSRVALLNWLQAVAKNTGESVDQDLVTSGH